MAIPVKLEVFEGPLDLLLHLIDKHKINIYDIPIALLTQQYMAYLQELKQQDLDNMSEFLVMAATLLHIKSKMLLPQQTTKEEEVQDPRQELVERLLEYKMYKFASLKLRDRQLDAQQLFFKKKTLPQEIADYKEEINLNELLSGLTLSKLNDIFHFVMKRQVDKIDPVRSNFGKIEKEEISLTDKMRELQEYGLLHKTFSFRRLLEKQSDKMELIVTFLCVLELMKLGQIQVVQEQIVGDILITYLAEDIIEFENNQAERVENE